jgi:hypothetical protein
MVRGMGDGEGIEGERWEWGAEIVWSANKLKLTSHVWLFATLFEKSGDYFTIANP